MRSEVLRPLQLTLAIIKPDAVAQPHILKNIQQVILENDFRYVRSSVMRLKRHDAEEFYAEHVGRFFHNRLVTFMSSGPICVHLLARNDAISTWRRLMGPTKVFRTQYTAPDTIRGRFGLTDTRNSTHGSDSEESAQKEAQFFFPSFNWEEWYRSEEPIFRQNLVKYIAKDHIHVTDVNKKINECDNGLELTNSLTNR